jgi:prevent-host-death family protein
MNEATTPQRVSEVGVRDLKNNLSRYLDAVRGGQSVVVTDRGRPVARLSPVEDTRSALAGLIEAGIVTPPSSLRRRRPSRRVAPAGSVSDLVASQRR